MERRLRSWELALMFGVLVALAAGSWLGREQRALAEAVTRAMCGIGLRRTYAGMDGYDENTGGYYRKTFRFGRKVDKRWGRLMD